MIKKQATTENVQITPTTSAPSQNLSQFDPYANFGQDLASMFEKLEPPTSSGQNLLWSQTSQDEGTTSNSEKSPSDHISQNLNTSIGAPRYTEEDLRKARIEARDQVYYDNGSNHADRK